MIDKYVEDIEKALKVESYFSALALSLALPDICGNVEYPNETVSDRYKKWCNVNLSDIFENDKDNICADNPYLSGEVIFSLRNLFLHQGEPNINIDRIRDVDNKMDQFVIVLDDNTTFSQFSIKYSVRDNECVFKKLVVDVTYLCRSICEEASKYYLQNKDKFVPFANVMTKEDFLNDNSVHSIKDLISSKIHNKNI